jgi:transposase InsO family protein
MGLLRLAGLLLTQCTDRFRARSPLLADNARLRAENALLRHQLDVLSRNRKRPRLTGWDRATFVWLRRWFPGSAGALVLVTPQTVLRWHRAGYRAWWRWKSHHRGGRPPKTRETIELVRRLSQENPLWGAPRIHGEMLKLGYRISEATVAKYMLRRPPNGRSPSWKAFLRQHAHDIVAVDMLTVPTLAFERLFVFVVLGLGRRRIVHVEVTAHPTAQWLARQITEAFPWDTAPAFLVRDNDGAYGTVFRWRLQAMGIGDCPTRPHSPWQNGYAERVIGTIRRECLDHIIAVNAGHLRAVLRQYVEYYNSDRTHLALGKDSPNSRPIETEGAIVATPILGGLHHRYRRK